MDGHRQGSGLGRVLAQHRAPATRRFSDPPITFSHWRAAGRAAASRRLPVRCVVSETEAVGRRHGRRERGGQRVAQSPYRRPRLTYPRDAGRVGGRAGGDPRRLAHDPRGDRARRAAARGARDSTRRRGRGSRASGSASTAGMVLDAVANAPSGFTLHARNPAHSVEIGGDSIVFCSVGSAPNSSDLEGGRRPGNHADYQNFLRLIQTLNAIHITGGYPVEPVDLHPDIRHLECLRDAVVLTDKPFHAYSLGWKRIRDGIEIARIARGHDARAARARAVAVHRHQLQLAAPPRLADGGRASSRWRGPGQVGGHDPVHAGGRHGAGDGGRCLGAAERRGAGRDRAGASSCGPGRRWSMAGSPSNVDMKSGAPAFGTPEYMKAVLVGGQLARRYGLPYRTSNAERGNDASTRRRPTSRCCRSGRW